MSNIKAQSLASCRVKSWKVDWDALREKILDIGVPGPQSIIASGNPSNILNVPLKHEDF